MTDNAQPDSPADIAREVIGAALSDRMPLPSQLALTEQIITDLRAQGALAEAFEWAVNSETVHATFTDQRAAASFAQPGDAVHRRSAASPWVKVS
ncbi:MAG: hypothetical protein J0J04_08075 [Microbacterium sp.]|uniref:hypothetical protein n=1 Tax=Microbacterium sp. TaxID=51671 RepID=UPI001ACE7451|nr:hypothetical protein [Microbacterium sp.]MBN9214757.1 hypothetical protein [Microbacterium sp.]